MFERFIALIFVFIMMSNEFVSVAQAQSVDESFYSNNDILFYDPRCDTGVAEGLISLQGKDNLEKILKFLMENSGEVVTRNMLLQRVWNLSFDPQTNVIDVNMGRLRRQLEDGFETPVLETVRGAGYRLNAAMRRPDSQAPA